MLKFRGAEGLRASSGGTRKPTVVQAGNAFLKDRCFLFYSILVCCLTKAGTALFQQEFSFQLAFWL